MKNLFKSQTAFEVLNLLTKNAEKKFYLNELAKTLGKDPANISRELSNLVTEGLVQMIEEEGKKYYAIRSEHVSANALAQLFSHYRESNVQGYFDEDWMLAEEVPNMDPFFSQVSRSFVGQFGKHGGRAYKKVVNVYRDYNWWFYYEKKDANDVGEHLVDKMEKNPAFMTEVNEGIVSVSDEVRAYVDALPDDLTGLSSKKLNKIYQDYVALHDRYYEWSWIPVAADMFCDNLTNRGKKILREHGVAEEDINETLTLLTLPERPSLIKDQDDDLMKIGVKVQSDPQQRKIFEDLYRKFKEEDVKLFGLYTHSPKYEEKFEEIVRELQKNIHPEIARELQGYYEKYYYAKFLFTEEQGLYTFEHFLKQLVRLVANDSDLQKTLDEDKAEHASLMKQRAKKMDELKLNDDYKLFFHEWSEFMVTKIYRRFAQLYGAYKMVAVVEEIGNRIGLTIKQTKFMEPQEVEQALQVGSVDVKKIAARIPLWVNYTDSDGNRAQYQGDEAKKVLEYLAEDIDTNILEVSGQCGCQGTARGIVRIVNTEEDMQKMNEGDILVAISTQPDLVPAMKKAAAFVTDQGGVTSHAAIVAREMNKPCVIGTKIASKVLKDGMEVDVDANKGIVKIIKK